MPAIAEYEAVREDDRAFAVLPGHVLPEAERVGTGNDRFQVVHKSGLAGEVAETS